MKKKRISFVTKVSFVISASIFIAVFLASYIPLVIIENNNEQTFSKVMRVIEMKYYKDYFLTVEFYTYVREFNGTDIYDLYRRLRSEWWFIGEEGIIGMKGKEKYKEIAFSYFFFDGEVMRGDDPEIITNKTFIEYISNQIDKKETIEGKFEIVEVSSNGYLVSYVQANIGKTKGIIGMYFRPDYYIMDFGEHVFGKLNFIFVKDGKFLKSEITHDFNIKEVKEAYESIVIGRSFERDNWGYIKFGKHNYFIYRENYGDNIVFYEPIRVFSPILVSSVVGLPVSLLVFLFNLFFIGRVFNKIMSVSYKIGELGKKGGDLSYRVDVEELPLKEFRNIVENLNLFLDATEEAMKVVKYSFNEVDKGLESLNEVKRVADEIGVLLNKQEEVRQMIEEVSAMAGEVSSTVEEMTRTMEGVASSVERQYGYIEEISSMTEETVMTIGNITKRVNKADEILKELRDDALRNSGEVRRVVDDTRGVGGLLGNVVEIIGIIKEIADRIEVLSMNAGIEAAHAGEYGRGFAVVADEMGNLAEDSRKKAMDAEEVVKRVIDRVKGTIEKVEGSGEVFLRISERIKEVSLFIDEISASMVEVGKTNDVILKNVNNLVNYSESIKVAVMESKSGVEEIMKAIYEVNEASNNLNESFASLYDVLKGNIRSLVRVSKDMILLAEGIKKVKIELDKFKVSSIKSGNVKSITVVD